MPRCIICREKFTPKVFNWKACSNKECDIEYKTQLALKNLSKHKKTQAKEWKERKKKKKDELMTLSDWLKIAQTHFNHYIRLRDINNLCISCQKPPIKKNAGHYFNSHLHYNVRFDERNVNLQCEYCNTYLSGNLDNYRENLIKKIGLSEFEKLSQISKITRNFTIEEVKDIIDVYKQKIKELKKI